VRKEAEDGGVRSRPESKEHGRITSEKVMGYLHQQMLVLHPSLLWRGGLYYCPCQVEGEADYLIPHGL